MTRDVKSKTLNSKSDKHIVRACYRRCWYCQLNGYDVLDKDGCCKRCKTNLIKYPTRESKPFPYGGLASKNADEQIAREVLGTRTRFSIPDENGQGEW